MHILYKVTFIMHIYTVKSLEVKYDAENTVWWDSKIKRRAALMLNVIRSFRKT